MKMRDIRALAANKIIPDDATVSFASDLVQETAIMVVTLATMGRFKILLLQPDMDNVNENEVVLYNECEGGDDAR